MDLFPEILEEIVLKLESVEDVISLGSYSPDLARIVGQESIWRVVLAKCRLMKYYVRMKADCRSIRMRKRRRRSMVWQGSRMVWP